jgi:hypothetical protein
MSEMKTAAQSPKEAPARIAEKHQGAEAHQRRHILSRAMLSEVYTTKEAEAGSWQHRADSIWSAGWLTSRMEELC